MKSKQLEPGTYHLKSVTTALAAGWKSFTLHKDGSSTFQLSHSVTEAHYKAGDGAKPFIDAARRMYDAGTLVKEGDDEFNIFAGSAVVLGRKVTLDGPEACSLEDVERVIEWLTANVTWEDTPAQEDVEPRIEVIPWEDN